MNNIYVKEKKYVIFGAGAIGRQALDFIGKEKVAFFVDNSPCKQGSCIEDIAVLSINSFTRMEMDAQIVVAVSEKYMEEILIQLKDQGISNYITFSELKNAETKKKLQNRIDYISIYDKAITWIKNNTISGEGIICNSKLQKPYPEVSGYYIPTLIRWGYRDLAIQYAKWLCDIQHDDGAWYDTQNKAPYIFDTAQILKGLIAVREYLPVVDEHIVKGCDWILGNMTSEGRLMSPLENPWGDGKTFSELIHTYCISPILEAGKILGRCDYVEKSNLITEYYITKCRSQILNFDLLSHFYAYVMEAMIDIGHEELAREAMDKIAAIQKESGAVPGYNNVDWVCSTGLFQLSLVWFRLGDIERGNKAFKYACALQNETGGWYGSYISEENVNEVNTYFPDAEISWANKYFLDALYYKNLATFEKQADIFMENIDFEDGRYKCIESLIGETGGKESIKILDVGCGKGRYLRNLISVYPKCKYYAADLSSNVMRYLDDLDMVEKKQGTMTNLPFNDDSFDIVYTCEALEHAVDIRSAVKEISRVTKPGGIIAIIDKNKDKLGYFEIDEWEQWFTDDELMRELSQYCSEVKVKKSIPFEKNPANGLFYCWVGKKRE